MVTIIAIIVFILILVIIYLYRHRGKKRKTAKLPFKPLPCKYCGVDVAHDFIIIWRNSDFDGVCCGKEKCLNLYKKDHEKFTNNEQTSI